MSTDMEKKRIGTVHVIDDDDSFRMSILRMLHIAELNALGYRCAGDYLLSQLRDSNPHECSCILLDISMPGPSGIDPMKVIIAQEAAPPVIFITGLDDVLTCVDVLKCGALDYVVKPVHADRILVAVHNALRVDAQRRAARSELQSLRVRFSRLTDAERLVFNGIINNKLNKQLAGELGTCERTIKTRRAHMMEKLQVETIPELVKIARLLEQSSEHHPAVRRMGAIESLPL
jgi:FixJ family two-component response regulator